MATSIPPADTDIDRHRGLFPVLKEGTYLLSHSAGPMPRTVVAAMQDYLERWTAHPQEDAWEECWWKLCDQAGDGVARLLGAASGSVQMQPNASIGLQAVLSCLDLGDGCRNRIVTSSLEFPTTGYILEEQRRAGAEIHTIPRDGLTTPLESLVEAIDEQTALVVLSHVSFLTSHRIDPRPVVAKAHEVGARVLLDCYQSVGVVEMDVAGWGVDFVTGGTIKWLCGGPGCGYLYVRPELLGSLRPRLTGWIAHAAPLAFESGPIRYADSVRRFSQGTPNIPGIYSCIPGMQLIDAVGVPAIAAESRRRTQWMVEFARERGLQVNSPVSSEQRGGAVMFAADEPQEMVRRLAEKKIWLDSRPGTGLRASPHFFNTDEEIEAAMETIAEMSGRS